MEVKDIIKNNVNDNVVNKLTNNDNVTMNNVKRSKEDRIADKLVQELGNEDFRAFYCKVAYKLSESQIWQSLELAKTGNNPAKYFTWLAKRMMSNAQR